jgi:hypothetical protein
VEKKWAIIKIVKNVNQQSNEVQILDKDSFIDRIIVIIINLRPEINSHEMDFNDFRKIKVGGLLFYYGYMVALFYIEMKLTCSARLLLRDSFAKFEILSGFISLRVFCFTSHLKFAESCKAFLLSHFENLDLFLFYFV